MIPVDVHVAADPARECRRGQRDAERRQRAVARRGEQRLRPEPALLPEHDEQEAGEQRRAEVQELAPAPGDQERDERGGEEDHVRGLDREREADEETREHRLSPVAGVDRADDEVRSDDQQHHRREVRERGQPEQLRQRLLDVLAVVALDEQRDRDVRQRDPERRRPVAEHAPADARPDPVDPHERDRQQQERVDEDDPRQAGEDDVAGDAGEGAEQVRPAPADLGGRHPPVREHPARRPVEGLVAALVVEPPVVAHAEHEHQQGEPLDEDQRAEDDPGLTAERPQPGRGRPRGDARPDRPRALSEPHASGPARDTRQSSVRGPRAAACGPRTRTAPSRGRRPGFGVAARSASTRPRRSRR